LSFNTNCLKKIVYVKTICAFEAAKKNRSRLNETNDDCKNTLDLNWSTGVIKLFYNEETDEIIIKVVKTNGDSISETCRGPYRVYLGETRTFPILLKALENSFNEKNYNWIKRKNLLMLKRSSVNVELTHITQYLFNDFVCMDICCYY
jgi:hypothetical protein